MRPHARGLFISMQHISLAQRRLRGQLIEVFKYLNVLTSDQCRRAFDYDLNDTTRNNGVKVIIKH